jgi:tetratricopeptide (TPR) repeat protein
MPEMPLRRRFILEAVPLLSTAVESYRKDVPAWEALGFALEKSGDPRSALTVYETALGLAPDSEMALVGAAANAEALGDSPLALDYWQRAVRVDPWRAAYPFHVARLLGGSGHWPEARDAARSALRLEPANLEFRLVSILTHLRAGEKERALAEGEVLPRLPPEGRQFARRWFEQQRLLSAEEKALLSRGLNEP